VTSLAITATFDAAAFPLWMENVTLGT